VLLVVAVGESADLTSFIQLGTGKRNIGLMFVSGVGFLSVSVIFKDGPSAHGLNTAAAVWRSAAIGVPAGLDFLYRASATT
jgi:putative Mg2+ transporter-C (MgtC) family protein